MAVRGPKDRHPAIKQMRDARYKIQKELFEIAGGIVFI